MLAVLAQATNANTVAVTTRATPTAADNLCDVVTGMFSRGGMNTFDTNASGNSVALVTAGVASLLGTTAETIRPRAENAATPTMNVTMAAGAVRKKITIPKKMAPAPSMIPMARIATQVDEHMRPAM